MKLYFDLLPQESLTSRLECGIKGAKRSKRKALKDGYDMLTIDRRSNFRIVEVTLRVLRKKYRHKRKHK